MDRPDLARITRAGALVAFLIGSAASAGEAPVAFPFDVGDLPPGETLVLEFQASVPAAPVPAGVESVTNQATVSGDGFPAVPTDDPDTGAAGDPTVTLIAAAPDLAVVKTVVDILDDAGVSTGQTAIVRPGNTVVYQLAWQNKAAATQVAAMVELSEMVPVDTLFDAGNSTGGWSCADMAPAGSPCVLALGSLAPGSGGTSAFAVSVLDTGLSGAGQVTNTGAISLPADDPVPADNSSTVMTTLLVEADLAVAFDVDLPMPIAGEAITATVTVTNNGPEPATGVVIADDLFTIAELMYLGDDSAMTGTAYVPGTGTWTLAAPLAPAATIALVIDLQVLPATPPGTMRTATAAVGALGEDDPVAANDSDSFAIEVKAGDYGDAPDPLVATAGEYPTLLANDGPRHAIPNDGAVLFFGAAVDADADGQPNADATGDDAGGIDDEDGVVFLTLLEEQPVRVEVTASAAGLLDAWIDFDRDGVFGPADQIFTARPLTAGTETITSAVTVPVATEGDTFARFRLSTAGGLPPTGHADDGEVEDYEVTIIADAVPPTVLTLAVIGAGELTECRTVLGGVSQLAVTFSEPMANAEEPGQYRLLAAGPDADLDTAACGGAPALDDRDVAIVAAQSDGDPTPTVTLDLAGGPRASGPHRLIVCGTLTDEAGNGLDGGAGAGSDLARTFRVDRFNALANGHFDDCDPADVAPVIFDGWTLTPPVVVAPSRQDGDGAAISGSLLADLADETLASAAQTAGATGGQRYALRSRYRLQLDAGAGVAIAQGCQFFDQPGGTGLALGAVQDQVVETASTAGWVSRVTLLEAPPGAQSARCAWTAQGMAAGATPPMFELLLDDLAFDVEIFSDGFESGDVSSWSAAVPGGGP